VATQNPVEFEGTYPLPEAQVDRFLFKLLVDHLSSDAERDVLLRQDRGLDVTDLTAAGLSPVVDADAVLDLRAQVVNVRVDDSVAAYMVAINRATRTMPEVHTGASVRGALGLMKGAKVTAAFAGRDFVVPDDVKYVAPAVLRHRILLKPEAELDGVRPDDVLERILTSVPVPR
jgi:MoxR-like ATPase